MTALSGMRYAERVLHASAHNVSNLLTDGFQAQRVSGEELTSGGVQSALSTPALPSPVLEQDSAEYRPGSGPEATSSVKLDVNLDPTDATAEAEEEQAPFSTEVSVRDSLGNPQQIHFDFVKTDDGQWTWQATIPGGKETDGQPNEDLVIGSGSIGFNTKGKLETEESDGLSVTFPGASPQDIEVDFGDSITTDGGTGNGSTSYVGGSRIKTVETDGHGVLPPSHAVNKTLGPGSNTDLVMESVNRITALNAYSANAAAFRTADEMNATVLDLLA